MSGVVERYEAFCDASYYDMWCVRPVGERTFGAGFHVLNEKSATELKAHLEAAQSEIATLRADLARAREALGKADAALEVLTPASISQFKNKLAAQTLISAALKEQPDD